MTIGFVVLNSKILKALNLLSDDFAVEMETIWTSAVVAVGL